VWTSSIRRRLAEGSAIATGWRLASSPDWHGDDVLKVPAGALFRHGNEWMTFAVKERKARLHKVEIAHNNAVEAEVRSGLSEGDAVIVHPPDAVHDGASVVFAANALAGKS
jgi:hypothetical protein